MICAKSDRECVYAGDDAASPANTVSPNTNGSENASTQPRARASTVGTSSTAGTAASPARMKKATIADVDPHLLSPELMFDSPLTSLTSMPSPNSAPLEWYDLLAEDAIENINKYNLNLDLDGATLSRRQSIAPGADFPAFQAHSPMEVTDASALHEQWNSPEVIPLTNDELHLLQHYVHVIGPVLDHYDPSKQFSSTVPRLAVHNTGVLKSLLAVSARHQALLARPSHQPHIFTRAPDSTFQRQESTGATLPHISNLISAEPSETNGFTNPLLQVATQYYYECLHYLSQNLLYPSYSKSREIIATALLISTYEMFDAEGKYSNGAWERHLRGIFWIQRSQNNNGECPDPLRRAAWWQWIRQDIWVAFREGRRVLTIWRPTRRLIDLSPDELCLRVIYICGRCVDFAANEKKYDMTTRIDQGEKLLQALEDWHRTLPSTFQPIYRNPQPVYGTPFTPIWITPPSYAGAIQTFHFARIIVLINQPSMGGMEDYRGRQKYLDESVDTICGIAMMHENNDKASAHISFQALYAAGLCVQDPVKQGAILQLLEKTLETTKFPPKTLLDDLANYWRAAS